jgi:hypothetical protein
MEKVFVSNPVRIIFVDKVLQAVVEELYHLSPQAPLWRAAGTLLPFRKV